MTLTIDKDFRADLGDARDQGRRPTCLSFAASDAHRHRRRYPKLLSVEWLFYHVAKHAGTGANTGTTMPDTRAVLQALGQPEEAVWPYSKTHPAPTVWQPPSSSPDLMCCGSTPCAENILAVRAQVDEGIPVVIGMFTSTTFQAPTNWAHYGAEIVLGRDSGEPIDPARGHALLVVGRGWVSSEPILLVRNSWGPKWGTNGHAWLYEDYLAPRLAGAFVISKGEDGVLQSYRSSTHADARLG